MKTKIIIVPENEAYYFCKRIFFQIFGDVGVCFANNLIQQGWTVFPFYKNENPLPNVILFAIDEKSLDKVLKIGDSLDPSATKYNIKVIITDINKDSLVADEKIDISNLQDYYQTELSLNKFINEVLEIDMQKYNTTSHKD